MPLFSTTKIQHLRPPYPPDPNEYNPTQEETLRKKKAKNPPLLFSLPISLSISPFKNKDTRPTNAGREKTMKNRGDPTPS